VDVLLVLNDGRSTGGRSEAALELAIALLRAEEATVRVFLLNDAVQWAAGDAHGRSDVASDPVASVVSAGGVVAVSDVGMSDHGLSPGDLVIGTEPTALSTLAAWCLTSDRLLVF
jgi:sulfur relay (sulfurtransferase) complex TusBCD TusD component (DsrE family)